VSAQNGAVAIVAAAPTTAPAAQNGQNSPSEILDKPVEWSVSEAAKLAFVSADPNRGSVSTGLEPTLKFLHAHCLWWAGFQAAFDRWVGSKVLLHGPPATVLDRCAPLDDAGDRGGPPVGRLPEGISHEPARCLRGVSVGKTPYRRSISVSRV
jgi:hypothetical protein